MKINYMVFASLLIITTSSYAFDSYEFTPSEDNSYYGRDYDREENYNYQGNYDNNDTAQNDYDSEKYSRYYTTKNHYVGGGKAFVFDPKSLRWFAYYNGSLINMGRASGGRFYCPDIGRPCRTPVGVFRIGHKGGPDCKSSKYPIGKGNAPMPWCMFFKGGFAIHGSWAVPNYNASHGCIRVPPSDAQWLNTTFMSPGTKVIVQSYH
jgi:hypothetical protein